MKTVMPMRCIFVSYSSASVLTILNILTQTIYPNVALNDVENIFWHGLELTKAPLLTELGAQGADKVLFDCMQDWLPTAHIIDLEKCPHALLQAAWATPYGRYLSWHKELDKPCNT